MVWHGLMNDRGKRMIGSLRDAIVYADSLIGPLGFTAQNIAGLALTETDAAAVRYLSNLTRLGVLREVGELDGSTLYAAGPGWDDWLRVGAKTNPGGNSIIYRRRKAVKESFNARLWAHRMAGGEMPPKKKPKAETVKIPREVRRGMLKATRGQVMSISCAARILGLQPGTVYRAWSRGQMKGLRWVVLNGVRRVRKCDLDEYMASLEVNGRNYSRRAMA